MPTEILHFIDGREVPSAGDARQDVYNPATGKVTGTLHIGEQDELKAAVASARKAAESWNDISIAKRTAVLFAFRELIHAHTDELAEIITSEHGKVFSDARARWAAAWRSWSSRAASPSTSRASSPSRPPRASTSTRSASPSVWSRGSRRSTFR